MSSNNVKLSLTPFFSQTKDIMCIIGYDGFLKKVNPAFSEILGYTEEELGSVPINDLIHPEDQAKTLKVRNLLKANNPIINYENRYLTKSGDIIWLLWTSMPVNAKNLFMELLKTIPILRRLKRTEITY